MQTRIIDGLYHLGVRTYAVAVSLTGLFAAKPRARSRGARLALQGLAKTPAHRDCYWMHCASVGEYEQGRPVWEALQQRQPDARFVLSFFSPSGYDHFVGQEGHGEVVYLPWDYGERPSQFVERLTPKPTPPGAKRSQRLRLAIFVKYEWWFGYFHALSAAGVPTVLISASVRPGHPILGRATAPTWSPYRRVLSELDQVFAQHAASAQVLARHGGGERVVVAGDTRLDRVLAVTQTPLDAPLLEEWATRQRLLLVAGSTWPIDERQLAEALAQCPAWSTIVAPHEVGEQRVLHVAERFADHGPQRASQLRPGANSRVVILDSIGLLSRVYRLGQLAYVGGGFGAGIHNLLEPVAYGLPVAFGPRHERFAEAAELIQQSIGTEVQDAKGLRRLMQKYIEPTERRMVLAAAQAYIATQRGATERIISYLERRAYV